MLTPLVRCLINAGKGRSDVAPLLQALNGCFPTDQFPLWVGCRPSLLTKAAIQAAHSLNVDNLCDTGHSAEATPPAAMADEATVNSSFVAGRSSAEAADGDFADYFRYGFVPDISQEISPNGSFLISSVAG